MSSTQLDEHTIQFYPTKSKTAPTYNQFKLDHALSARNIFADFLLSLRDHSTVEWWFDIYRLGDSDLWKKSTLSYLCDMKHNLLIVFLNIAGLVRIDGRHHVQIVHDSWTNFFIQYNLADYCKVSKAKLKLVDNKQFIHWFLKIGENCKHEPMYQFKEKSSKARVFCKPFTKRKAFFRKFTDKANVILASLMNSFILNSQRSRNYVKQFF